MSQDGVGMGAPDFHLPDEILAVIPTDPYDQLDLARKITSMAIASRVSNLEFETSRLKQNVHNQDRLIFRLEEKASRLEQDFQEADSRLKAVLDENMKLAQERDSLSATVKQLSRNLAKLETFKRQLMQSLSEDAISIETVDIGTCDQSVPRAYPDKAMKQAGQRVSMTPYQITPRLTPTETPKVISTSGSPISYSAVASPLKNSRATTPTESKYDGQASLLSWCPSSQQSSAANSPPPVRTLPSRTSRIDGKEFFRQTRSRLSYEQFSAFLANIKELNAHKQSREETLRKMKEIFGKDNEDLYLSFQGLLNRKMH